MSAIKPINIKNVSLLKFEIKLLIKFSNKTILKKFVRLP